VNNVKKKRVITRSCAGTEGLFWYSTMVYKRQDDSSLSVLGFEKYHNKTWRRQHPETIETNLLVTLP